MITDTKEIQEKYDFYYIEHLQDSPYAVAKEERELFYTYHKNIRENIPVDTNQTVTCYPILQNDIFVVLNLYGEQIKIKDLKLHYPLINNKQQELPFN